jgi:energy-coupling factor transporter ATP-binding protein EcfA2
MGSEFRKMTRHRKLTRVRLERFTAFSDLDMSLSPGINVFVGANGTGKTHLLKVCYAACALRKEDSFAEKLVGVFLPSGRAIGRLVKRQRGGARGAVGIYRDRLRIRASFSNRVKTSRSATVTGARGWSESPVKSAYIPAKEILSNAPGFLSLYEHREVHSEEVYKDLLDRAYLPPLRGPIDSDRRPLLDSLRKAFDGKVYSRNEEFFLRSRQGNIEFTLLAEGVRKLGLLWLLIQNGTLLDLRGQVMGSILFWDEPETNLNPRMFGPLVDILLELQRAGVQVFLATHDYVMLKELDLRMRDSDDVAFHSLYREEGEMAYRTTRAYLGISPNAIDETFTDLYDREVERSLGRLGR